MNHDDLLKLQDPVTNLKQTVETLMIMQDEDRMSLYTALSIAVAYLNGHEMTPAEIDKQKLTVNDILTRYEIHSMKVLNDKTRECGENLKNHGLIRKPPLGGIQ